MLPDSWIETDNLTAGEMTCEKSIVRVENSCVAENVEEQAADDIGHDLHTSRPREPSDLLLDHLRRRGGWLTDRIRSV